MIWECPRRWQRDELARRIGALLYHEADVLINGAFEIWVDRGKGLELTDREFSAHEDLVAAVERAIAPLGIRIDRAAPMVSVRLADGSRLHDVLPPASVDIPLVAIRRFTQRIDSLESLVETGGRDHRSRGGDAFRS